MEGIYIMSNAPESVPLHEGLQLLGLDKSGFYYYVNTKQIKSYSDTTPAQYDYQDIMKVREKRTQKLEKQRARSAITPIIKPKPKGATFTKMKPEDMTLIAPLIEELFGSYPDIERWSSLIAKNPDIAYMLISEGKTVGCGFIMPLTEQKILDIFSKEVTPPTFPDEVQDYHPGLEYYLYARTIGVTQTGISTTQRRFWGGMLVRNLMKSVIDLGSRGIIIKKIYGRSDTPEGLRLMHDMGFTQIRTTTTHKNFVINVEASGLDVIIHYERALNQWRQKHQGDLT